MRDLLDALVHQLVDRGILFNEARGEFEKRYIKKVLDAHRGNQLRTAKTLGIHRNTLGRKIDLYKLPKPKLRRK